jgi:hypothetical protein
MKFAAFLLVLFAAGEYALADDMLVEWDRVTENTDGTLYTDPKGYRLYFGPTEVAVKQNWRMLNVPLATSANVTGITTGQYFVCIAAVNLLDAESECSNVKFKATAGYVPPVPKVPKAPIQR